MGIHHNRPSAELTTEDLALVTGQVLSEIGDVGIPTDPIFNTLTTYGSSTGGIVVSDDESSVVEGSGDPSDSYYMRINTDSGLVFYGADSSVQVNLYYNGINFLEGNQSAFFSPTSFGLTDQDTYHTSSEFSAYQLTINSQTGDHNYSSVGTDKVIVSQNVQGAPVNFCAITKSGVEIGSLVTWLGRNTATNIFSTSATFGGNITVVSGIVLGNSLSITAGQIVDGGIVKRVGNQLVTVSGYTGSFVGTDSHTYTYEAGILLSRVA
jgi:hypothetical protein